MRRENRGGNKNDVPSARERRALNTWMLGTFGDGITVACQGECGKPLLYSEITRDRFPLPGRKGGRYVRGNIRPMCMSCNAAEGARAAAEERRRIKERQEAKRARDRAYRARKRREAGCALETTAA